MLNVPAARVWQALTRPELVKQYLFGTEMNGKGLKNVAKSIIHGDHPSLIVLSVLKDDSSFLEVNIFPSKVNYLSPSHT